MNEHVVYNPHKPAYFTKFNSNTSRTGDNPHWDEAILGGTLVGVIAAMVGGIVATAADLLGVNGMDIGDGVSASTAFYVCFASVPAGLAFLICFFGFGALPALGKVYYPDRAFDTREQAAAHRQFIDLSDDDQRDARPAYEALMRATPDPRVDRYSNQRTVFGQAERLFDETMKTIKDRDYVRDSHKWTDETHVRDALDNLANLRESLKTYKELEG